MKACPLCGSKPTEFVQMIGVPWPFEMQICSNPLCELPCKLWEQIRLLKEQVYVLSEANEHLRAERDEAREAARWFYRWTANSQWTHFDERNVEALANWPWLKEK